MGLGASKSKCACGGRTEDFCGKPFVVCIDGNIGTGKTSLVESLGKRFSSFREPVERWSLLGAYYADPVKYAALLQVQILLSTFDLFRNLEDSRGGVVVVERCPWTQRRVFVELLKKKGYVDALELDLLDAFYEKLLSDSDVDLMIYLDAGPEECRRRIANRSPVAGDAEISSEYLRELKDEYERCLDTLPFPCRRIDVEKHSPESVEKKVVATILSSFWIRDRRAETRKK